MMARSSRRYSITSTGYIVDTQTGAIYANASDLQAGITVNTSTPASTVKATMAKTKITPQVSSGGQKFISSNVGTKISNTTGLGEVVSPRNEKIEQININKINIGEAQRELQKTDVLLGVERNKLKTTLNKGYVTDNEGERASARFSFLVNKKKDLNERLQQLQNKEIGINATPNKPTPSKNKKEKQIPFNIENFYPHIPNAFGETSDRYIIQELPAGSINPNLQSKPGGNNLQSKPDGNNLQSKPGGSNMSNEGKNMSNEGKNIIQDQMSIPDVTTQFKRASDIVNTSGFYLGTTGSQVKISRGGTEILPTSDEGKTIQAIYQEQLKTRLDNEEQRARWEKLTYGEASIREALLEPRTSNSYIRRDKGGNVVSITQGVPADRKASITKFFEERGISLDERFSTVKTGPTKYDDSLNFLTPEFFRKQEWSGFDDSTGQVVPVTYKKSSPGPVFADNNREQAVVERRTAFGQALKDFADRTDRQTDFILSPESITALKQYTQNVRSNNPTIKEFDIVIFDKKNNKQITTVAPADQLNQYLFVYAGRPQYEPLFIVPKGTSKEYIQQLNKSSITESNKLVVPFVPGTASFLMGAQLFVGGKELAMLADPSMPFNASTSVPTDMELFPWLKQELTVRDDKNKMTVIRAEPTKPVYDWVGLRVDDDSYKDIPLAGLLWIPDLIDQGRVMITGKSFTGQKEAVIHDTPFADLFASFIIPVIPELEKQAKAEGRTSFLIETPRTGLWQGNIPLNLKDISQVAIDTSANISNFFGAATQVENYWGKVGESNIQALDTYGLNPFAKEADVAARFTPGQRIGRFGYFVTAGGSELFAMWYTGGASLGASVTKKVATGVSNTAMKLSQKSLLAGALLQKSALPAGRTASVGAQFLDQANQLFLPLFFRSKPVQSILDKTGSSLTRGGTDLKIIFGEQKDRITSSLPPEIQNLMYGTNRQELQTRAGKFLYSAVDQSRRFVNRDLMKLYNTIQQGVLPAGQELGLRPTVSVVERKIDGITITEPERRVVQPENIQVGESVNTWVAKRNPYFEYYDPTQVILPRGTARTPPRTMSSIGTPITGGRKMQESLVRDEFGKPIEKVTDIDMSTGKRTPIFASGVSPITFEPWDVLPFGTRKKSGELYLYRADGTSLGKYEDFLNRKIEPEEYMPDSSLDEIISTVNDNWQLDVLKKSMIKDRPSLLNYIDRRKAELKKLESDIKAADSASFDSSLYSNRGEYRQSLNQRSTRMQREIEDLERFANGLRPSVGGDFFVTKLKRVIKAEKNKEITDFKKKYPKLDVKTKKFMTDENPLEGKIDELMENANVINTFELSSKQKILEQERLIQRLRKTRRLALQTRVIKIEDVKTKSQKNVENFIKENFEVDDDFFALTDSPDKLLAKKTRLSQSGITSPPLGDFKRWISDENTLIGGFRNIQYDASSKELNDYVKTQVEIIEEKLQTKGIKTKEQKKDDINKKINEVTKKLENARKITFQTTPGGRFGGFTISGGSGSREVMRLEKELAGLINKKHDLNLKKTDPTSPPHPPPNTLQAKLTQEQMSTQRGDNQMMVEPKQNIDQSKIVPLRPSFQVTKSNLSDMSFFNLGLGTELSDQQDLLPRAYGDSGEFNKVITSRPSLSNIISNAQNNMLKAIDDIKIKQESIEIPIRSIIPKSSDATIQKEQNDQINRFGFVLREGLGLRAGELEQFKMAFKQGQTFKGPNIDPFKYKTVEPRPLVPRPPPKVVPLRPFIPLGMPTPKSSVSVRRSPAKSKKKKKMAWKVPEWWYEGEGYWGKGGKGAGYSIIEGKEPWWLRTKE